LQRREIRDTSLVTEKNRCVSVEGKICPSWWSVPRPLLVQAVDVDRLAAEYHVYKFLA